jgi:phosphatidylglycerophosphate synthase
LNWQQACFFPDPVKGWAGAREAIVQIPAVVRTLLVLKRAGIERVHFPSADSSLQAVVEGSPRAGDLPAIEWQGSPPAVGCADTVPVLVVRWGVVYSPVTLLWFRDALGNAGRGQAVLPHEPFQPVFMACRASDLRSETGSWTPFQGLAAHTRGNSHEIPADCWCPPVEELLRPEGDRRLLDAVGKTTDRPHVRWVRRWSFPALRVAARLGLTPNQVTILGFAVALLGSLLLAQGNYWAGLGGAVLLYASWVLDCMDGTLARLTFAESRFGQQLDTVLGQMTNLGVFAALVIAVYGRGKPLSAGIMAILVLGGILLAYRLDGMEKRLRPPAADGGTGKLQGWLDKINHRDYAVVIFALALVNGFKAFLWLSLVGIHAYWATRLWLIARHRRAAAAGR